MNIIKSNYNYEELSNIYKQEDSKINKTLEENIKLFIETISALFIIAPIIALAIIVIINENLLKLSIIYVITLIFMTIGFFSFGFQEELNDKIKNHYKKRGIIFENPLKNYISLFYFVETGEIVYNALEKNPNLEITIIYDELEIYTRNSNTGMLELFEDDIHLPNCKCDLNKMMTSKNTLDFSIYDEEIKSILEKYPNLK